MVTLLSSFLCFFRLGSRAMWQDEGETAVLARSVLEHGVPLAKVGENLVLQDAVAFDDQYRWTFHPWGQFYLAAVGLKLLGESNLTARMPFALCGVATVSLLFVVAWRWWRSAGLATLAALLLAFSATFIVHARQCRYYAPDALACLCVTAAWVELLLKPGGIRAALLALAIAFQFYTNFGTLLGIAPGLLMLAVLLKPKRRTIGHLAAGAALGAALCLPGAIFHARRLTAGSSSEIGWADKIIAHLSYLDGWFIPLIPLFLAGMVIIIRIARRKDSLTMQGRIALGIAILFTLAAAIIALPAPIPHVRYLIGLMPLSKLVLAAIIVEFFGWLRRASRSPALAHLVVGLSILMLTITNVASVPIQLIPNVPDQQTPDFCTASRPYLRFDLAGLFYELSHDFESPDDVRLRVAADLAGPGETLLVNYGDLPLMFHRPDLILRGGVSGIGRALDEAQHPDLILLQANQPVWFSDYVQRLLQKADYQSIELTIADAVYGSIPEPRAHWFKSPTKNARFLVFLRKDHALRLVELQTEGVRLARRWGARGLAAGP